MVQGVEIPIDDNASAVEMAETIFGEGTTIVSASYTGDNNSSGIYSDGDSISPGVTPSDTGVMFSTGDLNGVTNSGNGGWLWGQQDANQSSSTTTGSNGPNNNADFNAAAGTNTYDASYLDVDFIPTGDVMTMQFVFASEEYPEYADGAFQDFVGIWINGTQVEMLVGDGDIDPNNLNAGSAENLFIDNTSSQYNTEMDGFTATLTLTIPGNSGEMNSIRVGIADVTDSNYDSTLLIAADSVQTTPVANDDNIRVDPDDNQTLDLLANDVNNTGGTLSISQIKGQAVVAGDTFGRHRNLLLSPLHRVLVRDSLSEVLFGEPEVLVAARDLVNDLSIRRIEGGTVSYVHILFDQHQVAYSEGLKTESFLPGPQITTSFEAEIVEEIYTLFPEIDLCTGAGYGPAAQPCLKPYEARLLLREQAKVA